MLKILYLEDSEVDVLLLKRALAQANLQAEVQSVSSSGDYKTIIAKAQFDVILSDAGLPGFSGLEALEIAQRQCPDIPFIFLSGSTYETTIKAALEAGGTDYVIKGHDWHLIQTIRRSLALKRSEQESSRLLRLNQAMGPSG